MIVVREKELYERYAARLLAVCLRYVGERSAAEDVLHDTFLKIFGSLGRFDFRSEPSLYAWMRRIAVNRSIDYLRSRARDTVPLDDNADFEEKEVGEGFSEKIPPDVLMRFIEELPDGFRTVFNLYCLDGCSHAEIARMLGIKEKTSSSQYFRARAILAKRINAYLDEQEQ